MPEVQSHLWLAVSIAAVLLILAALLVVLKKRRRLPQLEGADFEEYCAELLIDNGYEKVETTPASGDFGVDIFAFKDGVSWAFQCKYYQKPVGTRAVQEIYSGRDFYRCMVGVVITNNVYTKNAVKLAEAHNILLWDGEKLNSLAGR